MLRQSLQILIYFDCREREVIDNDRPLKSSVVSWPVYVEDRVPGSRSTATRLDPNRVDGSYKFGEKVEIIMELDAHQFAKCARWVGGRETI